MGLLPAFRGDRRARRLYLLVTARYLLIASTLVSLSAVLTLTQGLAALGAVFAFRSAGALLGSLITGAVTRRVAPQTLFRVATVVGAACRIAALLALLAGLPWIVAAVLGLLEQGIERFAYVQLQIGVATLIGPSALVGLGSVWAMCWALGSTLAGFLAATGHIGLLVASGVTLSVAAGSLAAATLPQRSPVRLPHQRPASGHAAPDRVAWRLQAGSPLVPIAVAFVVALLGYGPLSLEVGLTTDMLGAGWIGLGAAAYAVGSLAAPTIARLLPRGSREVAWWLLLASVCAAGWGLLQFGVGGLVVARLAMGASVYAVEGRLNASVVSRQALLGGSPASALSAVTAALTGGQALSSLLAGHVADHSGGVTMALTFGGAGALLVVLTAVLRPAAYRQLHRTPAPGAELTATMVAP